MSSPGSCSTCSKRGECPLLDAFLRNYTDLELDLITSLDKLGALCEDYELDLSL